MTYSKLFIVEVHRQDDATSKSYKQPLYTETIAGFDIGNMGDYEELKKLFSTLIDYSVTTENGEPLKLAHYGYESELYGTTVDKVIDWLEHYPQPNRRIAPLLGLLKGFKEGEWKNLQVVRHIDE